MCLLAVECNNAYSHYWYGCLGNDYLFHCKSSEQMQAGLNTKEMDLHSLRSKLQSPPEATYDSESLHADNFWKLGEQVRQVHICLS